MHGVRSSEIANTSGETRAGSPVDSAPSATLRWVNHASFAFDARDVCVLADPWLTGPAFNRGWSLLVPTPRGAANFEQVTHIWISHQHPDHFSPRDLRAIPPELRAKITLLYQKTRDRRVVAACKALGFAQVRELPKRRWIALSDHVSVMTDSILEDSWLAYKTPDAVFLNVNDCVIEDERTVAKIRRAVGAVDVLLSQFSYANWVGNPDEIELQRGAARLRLDYLVRQIQGLRPRFVVPFASYVYFANTENWYLNEQMNRVETVVERIGEQTSAQPIVLFPGDTWNVGQPRDNAQAIAAYAHEREERLKAGAPYEPLAVTREQIESSINAFYGRISRKMAPLLRAYPLKTRVYVTDLDLVVELSFKGFNVRSDPASAAQADLETSADNLLFALKTPWGGEALWVNARFRTRNFQQLKRFFNFFRVADITERPGTTIPWFIWRALPGVLRALHFATIGRFRKEVS
ncbi:MAG TPA: MBL fold metallo-hydrolase [Candidatus Baltobacteraceae bacterium]|jgi:hypothetical protein